MRRERALLLLPLLLVPAALELGPSTTSTRPDAAMATAPSPISVKLAVRADGRQVPVTIEFSNTSADKAFLYLPNACVDGNIRKNVFKVDGKGQSNAEVRYKGPYRKLAAPTPKDFLELEPERG